MVFKLSVVMVVGALAVLAGSGKSSPMSQPRHWHYWKQLQEQKQEQQQAQQQQQQMEKQQLGRLWVGSIREAVQRQRLLEERMEQEQERLERMEDIISGSNLEKISRQLIQDTLGRILRPLLNEGPTPAPAEDCVTRTAAVSFMELPQLSGHFVYTVCGSGDGAAMHLHFQKMGGTTPNLGITTPPEATTTPVLPLCPTAPTTPSPTTGTPNQTPTEPETTTSVEADVTTTTAAEVVQRQ